MNLSTFFSLCQCTSACALIQDIYSLIYASSCAQRHALCGFASTCSVKQHVKAANSHYFGPVRFITARFHALQRCFAVRQKDTGHQSCGVWCFCFSSSRCGSYHCLLRINRAHTATVLNASQLLPARHTSTFVVPHGLHDLRDALLHIPQESC